MSNGLLKNSPGLADRKEMKLHHQDEAEKLPRNLPFAKSSCSHFERSGIFASCIFCRLRLLIRWEIFDVWMAGGGCMAVKPFPSAFSLVGTAFSTYKRGQTADLAVVKMPNSLPNGAWCRGLLVGLTKGPSLLSWDDESAQVVRSNAFFLKGGGSCWYSHQQCVYCSGLAPDPIGGM